MLTWIEQYSSKDDRVFPLFTYLQSTILLRYNEWHIYSHLNSIRHNQSHTDTVQETMVVITRTESMTYHEEEQIFPQHCSTTIRQWEEIFGSLVPTLLHLTVTKTQSSIYAPSTLVQGSPCAQSGFSHQNQAQDLTPCNPMQNCSINLGFLWRMCKLKGEMLTENTLSCLKSVAT